MPLLMMTGQCLFVDPDRYVSASFADDNRYVSASMLPAGVISASVLLVTGM